MPIRFNGEEATEIRMFGESIPTVFYPLTPGESNNHQNVLFTNTDPVSVMITNDNGMPSPGVEVTFTATLVDADVPPMEATYVWSVDGVVQETNTVASLTNTFSHTRATAGESTISVSVTDAAGAGPVTDDDTVNWALSISGSSGANFDDSRFTYSGNGNEITFTSPVLTGATFPAVNTPITTFQVRAGGTNFAAANRQSTFGVNMARLNGNVLTLTTNGSCQAMTFITIINGENGWLGTGTATPLTCGAFGTFGFNTWLTASNASDQQITLLG